MPPGISHCQACLQIPVEGEKFKTLQYNILQRLEILILKVIFYRGLKALPSTGAGLLSSCEVLKPTTNSPLPACTQISHLNIAFKTKQRLKISAVH